MDHEATEEYVFTTQPMTNATFRSDTQLIQAVDNHDIPAPAPVAEPSSDRIIINILPSSSTLGTQYFEEQMGRVIDRQSSLVTQTTLHPDAAPSIAQPPGSDLPD